MSDLGIKMSGRGHVVRVRYVLARDIVSELAVGGLYSCVLGSGVDWKELYFTPGSGSIEINREEDFGGVSFTVVFSVDVPGLFIGNGLLNDIKRWMVLMIYFESGEILILGGRDKKLKLGYKGNVDKAKGSSLSVKYIDRIEPLIFGGV